VNSLKTPFFIGYGLFFLVGAFALLFTDKLALQLEINSLHSTLLDTLMPIVTFFGDGLFAILLSLALILWINRKWGWMLLFSYGVSSLIAQIGKHLLFPDAMRPFFYLKTNPTFHRIPGLVYHEFHSFPSGHTTTAFAIATYLALCMGKKTWHQFALLFGALWVGFSRIYLSQHFLVDVVFGSLIGVTTSLFLYLLLPSTWLRIETPYVKR
jgi:membrane-associated phospholipid phosphatase